MSPQTRRAIATPRASLASLAGVATRVASPRRARARARRWLARAVVAVPVLAVVAADIARRGAWLTQMAREDLATYAASVAMSAALWAALVVLAARARGAARWALGALLVLFAVLAVGAELYTFDRYQAYLNYQAVLLGTSMLPSVGQQLWIDRYSFARALSPAIALALALPWLARSLARPRRRSGWIAADVAMLAILVTAFSAPGRSEEQAATPDVLYVAAMGQLSRAHWQHNETIERVHPGTRTPEPVPALLPSPAKRRNVLFVLTESVRAQSACVAYDPDCKWTPFSNAAVPDRLPLAQMRAVDSTTAISLSVLWSGLPPDRPRAALHSAPLVFEYARAAGLGTAYWTSQNLLFGNSGEWVRGLPLDAHVSATQLDPDASLETGADDGKLVTHVLSAIGALKQPFLSVVHLSNTHFPYAIDDADAPWQPESAATGPGYEAEVLNRYRDSIYHQDRAVGRLLRELRASPLGASTVVVFLSDHGEQMREKGAVGHTGTLFEQEIRVPAWIDAPPGTLTDSEAASLRARADAPTTTLDVLPTLLDLAGLWDAPELAPFRASMPGQSLLRGGTPSDRAVLLTNCTELWQCAFKNWGAMQGTRKLIAHQYDPAWSCFDVKDDPEESHDLGASACGDELRALAEGSGRGRPF